MIRDLDPKLDLAITRIIKAPRELVWSAWADPAKFEKWWIPGPTRCEIVAMDMHPGGSFVTRMSDDGGPFEPHLTACFLDVAEGQRIVFTNTLQGQWRPAGAFYFAPMTAVISFADHPDGTRYESVAMHATPTDRDKHEQLGFNEGWGTAIDQLAALIEAQSSGGANG